MNLVSDGGDHCAAGHPSEPVYHVLSSGTPSGEDTAVSPEVAWTSEIEELVNSTQSQMKIWVEWHQQQVAPFDDPEFYTLGSVAFVYCSMPGNKEVIEIKSEGERVWIQEDPVRGITWNLQEPEEFRLRFPNGQLPDKGEDGWKILYCGWFWLSASIPVDTDVFYSLTKAIGYARDVLTLHARNKAPSPA
jgi:hypothetical protein